MKSWDALWAQGPGVIVEGNGSTGDPHIEWGKFPAYSADFDQRVSRNRHESVGQGAAPYWRNSCFRKSDSELMSGVVIRLHLRRG
jgi:hypothetical protein